MEFHDADSPVLATAELLWSNANVARDEVIGDRDLTGDALDRALGKISRLSIAQTKRQVGPSDWRAFQEDRGRAERTTRHYRSREVGTGEPEHGDNAKVRTVNSAVAPEVYYASYVATGTGAVRPRGVRWCGILFPDVDYVEVRAAAHDADAATSTTGRSR